MDKETGRQADKKTDRQGDRNALQDTQGIHPQTDTWWRDWVEPAAQVLHILLPMGAENVARDVKGGRGRERREGRGRDEGRGTDREVDRHAYTR